MTKENEVYKCGMCGNTVRVIAAGHGELVCCDQPMQVLESAE